MNKVFLISSLVLVSAVGAYVAYRYYFPNTYFFKCTGNTFSTYTNKETGEIERSKSAGITNELTIKDHGILFGKTIVPWSLSTCKTQDEVIFCQSGIHIDMFDLRKTKLTLESTRTIKFEGADIEIRDLWASTKCDRQKHALD